MKRLFCWRCADVVPMLDEDEFASWRIVFRRCWDSVREEAGSARGAASTSLSDVFAPALAFHASLTGVAETNVNAIQHHRLSLYGPLCPSCGKPLRTPRANVCAACGEPRRDA